MHVYGVGVAGEIGSGVQQLFTKKYNQERGRREGNWAEEKTIAGTINAEILRTRITTDSNRVAQLTRPFITVDAEVRDVWGDVGENVDHLSFIQNNRPVLTYEYPLNDRELKGLIDAGMYHNPRFEPLLNKLMENEQFEVAQDVTVKTLDAVLDENVVPIVLVNDVGLVKQPLNEGSEEAYTSFGSVIDRAVDMALQLEAEGISADQVIGEEQVVDQEVFLDIDDEFDVTKAAATVAEVVAELNEEERDVEVDITQALDFDNVFGKTSEEERIEQLKVASERGVDWDEFKSSQDLDDDDDNDVHLQNVIDTATDDIVLTNVESYDIDVQVEPEDDEDDLEF